MRNKLIILIIATTCMIIMWLAVGAFYNASLSISEWDIDSRAVICFCYVLFQFIVTVNILIEKDLEL